MHVNKFTTNYKKNIENFKELKPPYNGNIYDFRIDFQKTVAAIFLKHLKDKFNHLRGTNYIGTTSTITPGKIMDFTHDKNITFTCLNDNKDELLFTSKISLIFLFYTNEIIIFNSSKNCLLINSIEKTNEGNKKISSPTINNQIKDSLDAMQKEITEITNKILLDLQEKGSDWKEVATTLEKLSKEKFNTPTTEEFLNPLNFIILPRDKKIHLEIFSGSNLQTFPKKFNGDCVRKVFNDLYKEQIDLFKETNKLDKLSDDQIEFSFQKTVISLFLDKIPAIYPEYITQIESNSNEEKILKTLGAPTISFTFHNPHKIQNYFTSKLPIIFFIFEQHLLFLNASEDPIYLERTGKIEGKNKKIESSNIEDTTQNALDEIKKEIDEMATNISNKILDAKDESDRKSEPNKLQQLFDRNFIKPTKSNLLQPLDFCIIPYVPHRTREEFLIYQSKPIKNISDKELDVAIKEEFKTQTEEFKRKKENTDEKKVSLNNLLFKEIKVQAEKLQVLRLEKKLAEDFEKNFNLNNINKELEEILLKKLSDSKKIDELNKQIEEEKNKNIKIKEEQANLIEKVKPYLIKKE
jgi:hypothetical protein